MDGFTIVKSKRKSRRAEKTYGPSEICITNSLTNKSALKRKIEESSELLQKSNFFNALVESIGETHHKVNTIICYGLGSFSTCYISRTQLGFLVSLQRYLGGTVYLYDPIFNPTELEVLESFNFNVYKNNDEGKRAVDTSEYTLIYFPHCSKQLVNNFLWANWGPNLVKCVLLSNSFKSIAEKNTSKTLESISCLRDIRSATVEVAIPDTFEVQNVFNDLSVHTFSADKPKTCNFWSPRPEPIYTDQDIEFITKGVNIKLEII